MSTSGPDPVSAASLSPGASPAQEYLAQWQAGGAPQIEAFLAVRGGIAPRDLASLVRVDLRERWRRGECPDVGDYLARFPVLAADPELAVDVIYTEFLIREACGEQPAIDEYRRRFPAHAIVLQDQVRLHQAFDQRPRTDSDSNAAPLDSASYESIPEGSQPAAATRLEADYEILEEVGRGGMGVVFKARQTGLNRLVALKMVRPADATNCELLSRFRAEAEVVASLHHPHIVQIYDYGEHDGSPYLALEWVGGGTLADRLDGSPWSPRSTAMLVERLARAVQFAHEHGVVHRDLKPTNLLVAAGDDSLEIKIADFGLAKVFRDSPTSHTQTGALLGTPSYMAPEQAYGRSDAIGPATDVYALGAILYELLTGRPPFRGKTAIETLQQVLLAEPASIHRLSPTLPRDLATICTKCLQREPQRRYSSAVELADDLQRFLSDQPIRARRTGNWERCWRWCRRNPVLAAALGAVAVSLVAVAAVSMWYSDRLSRQLSLTQTAESAEREANTAAQSRLWDAYLAEIAARNSSRQVGQRFEALATLNRARQLLETTGVTEDRVMQLRSAAITSLALPDIRRLRSVCQLSEQSRMGAISLAADRYVVGLPNNELVVGQLSDGSEMFRIKHGIEDVQATISPNGRFIAASGIGGTRVWNVEGSSPTLVWEGLDACCFTFAPDSRHAAVSRAGQGMLLIDLSTGLTARSLGDEKARTGFSFHAPSRRLAVCTAKQIEIIAWDTGERAAQLPPIETAAGCLAWHPSGEYLAAWDGNEGISLWHLPSGEKKVTFPHRGYPLQLYFTKDGARLLSCSLWDSRMKLWDVGTGEKMLEVQGFVNLGADDSPEGPIVLLRLDGATGELWELAAGSECRSLSRALFSQLGGCVKASISPDSRLLAISREKGLELWDLSTSNRLAMWPGQGCLAEFDRAGQLLMACDAGIFRWPRVDRSTTVPEGDHDKPTTIVTFGPPAQLNGPVVATSLATDPLGEVLVFEEAEG